MTPHWEALQSSQSFVRALKANTDPPLVDGPSKIQIARLGWDSESFYIPRKAGLISEWILTRFHKEKYKKSNENPLLDSNHWSLLADILAHPSDTQIGPLIVQASVPNLVASLIPLYPSIATCSRASLLRPLLRSLTVLWPLAVQRASLDSLAECFWGSLTIADQLSYDPAGDGFVDILSLVITSFHTALDSANSTGKRKLYTAMSQHQFIPWLRSLQFVPPTHPFHDDIYLIGIEILYNPDSIRSVLECHPTANASSNLFSILFGSSTVSDPVAHKSLLRKFPGLFKAYIMALRRLRSSIFSGTLTIQEERERIRRASIRFGDECLSFLKSMSGVEPQESIWKTIVHVLQVVEEEVVLDFTDQDAHATKLKELWADALGHLDHSWDDSHFPLVTNALDVIACLHRIEPAIEPQILTQILERLVTASPALSRPALALLCQLVSYHSKTRTLHTLVSHLISALSSSFLFLPVLDPKAIYSLCTSSPFLSLAFTDKFTNALRTFATPGQVDEIVKSIFEALVEFLPASDVFEEPVKKRRRSNGNDHAQNSLTGQMDLRALHVVRFALLARLAATTLDSLSRNNMGQDSMEKTEACLVGIDTLISDAIGVVFSLGHNHMSAISHTRRKRSSPETVNELGWMQQCFCSALLRLWYELFAQRCGSWIVHGKLDRFEETFASCLEEDLLPELHLEIGRVFYARKLFVGPDALHIQKWHALDAILDYMESNLPVTDVTPPGMKHSFTKQHSALALWSLTLDRYLSTVDLYASHQQLDRLVGLMIRARHGAISEEQDQLSAGSVLTRALTSANFWECSNLRTSMSSVLDTQTAAFDSIDNLKWVSAIVDGDDKALKMFLKLNNVSLVDVEAGAEVYHFLRSFPPDYLSRASRLALSLRALSADILVRVLSPNTEPMSRGLVEWRALFRSFVFSAGKQANMKFVVDLVSNSNWLAYLTLAKHGPLQPTEAYTRATLDLLSLTHALTMRAALPKERDLFTNVVNNFLRYSLSSDGIIDCETLAFRSFLRFICTLVQEFNIRSLPEFVPPLRQICTSLEEKLRPAINDALNPTGVSDFLASERAIEAWHVLLSLRRWLLIESSTETLGETLGETFLVNTARVLGSGSPDLVSKEFCATILSLLTVQSHACPPSDCRHVTPLVAAYILFVTCIPQAESTCDIVVTRASKSFSVAQYASALDLITAAMENESNSQPRLMALIHLSTLFQREAPDRTSKLSHEHASHCLRIFINQSVLARCTSLLAAQILDFIKCLCTERVALLKASDAACILTTLSKLLVGCPEHDRSTTPSIFQSIVHILNALVRLRRDLLSPHLPQLSMVLRQLISALPGVRPLLGIKQHRLVADSFPRWINPTDPVDELEAQSLSRLLTAINTKSLARSHGASENQKAESLARPFARHAPYVLLSYLRVMNDPLIVLPINMRHELEPGLFALCTMMGEHGRDTLMIQSLDIGGKALLMSLWKEYDRQKYIGRG
ncbi:hypothetical protein K439DRAFT_628418 [Ramaria rubella]|nr:hypothetical protein K439DRAFT_628418 [Ramaria rubella]